jgi:hypothetical protein
MSKISRKDRQLQILKEDDFEKVIEYTESDEEAEVRANAATIGLLDDDNQNLQLCEEIVEVSDESL